MGIRKFRPITPGTRFRSVPTFEEITSSIPEKSLLEPIRKSGGRNNKGRLTAYRVGGGHKRMYRIMDFKRNKFDVPARVASIEYDPNRNARIALLHYADGEKRYIVAPDTLKVGDAVMSGENVENKIGNCTRLANMPLGTTCHNIELRPGKGAQMARSAGTFVQIMAKEGNIATLKMPSGEVRTVPISGFAVYGQVSNLDHKNLSYGKAGVSRWLGIRPSVRGVAMNPIDHPMGGGEGKSSGGRHPCTPWGKATKGLKTRSKRKRSDYIIEDRRAKKTKE